MTGRWWTPADAAEQAVLVRELVDWDFAHREAGCDTCEYVTYCPERRRRIEELLDWRDNRSARSLAAELRAIQDLIDLPELTR